MQRRNLRRVHTTASILFMVLMLAAAPVPQAFAQTGVGPLQPDMLDDGSSPVVAPPQALSQGTPDQPSVADIFVDDDFNVSTPGWGVTHFATIQNGINAAAPGNTISVYPGNYAENVNVDRALTLQSFAGTGDFSGSVNLSATQAPGYWYTDRYAPGVFATTSFGGGTVLQHGIRAVDYQPTSFYNYQGRKLDTDLTGSTQAMTIDLWVDSSWLGADRNAAMWATGFDNVLPIPVPISAYPILGWRSSGSVTPGFYAFDYVNGGWLSLMTASAGDYGRWHTLSLVLTVGTGIEYFVDGQLKLTFADPDTTDLGNVILNAYNYGADYDVYWDNFQVRSSSPAAFLSAITGQMTIAASDVTVDGFYMTNPGQPYAVLMQSNTPSYSNISLIHNIIENVGSASLTANAHAVLVNRGADNVTISHNRFNTLKSDTRSVSAIGVLDTASTDPSSDLLIEDNIISDVVSTSRGAYGIIINNGAGAPDAQILDNTISDLDGLWAHGIGLEGPTPNALVQGNRISNLVDHKVPTDAVAIQVESNPSAGTVNIDQNCFTAVNIGVQNTTGITVDAEENWWGHGSGPYHPTTNPGGTGAAATDNVDFNPWVTEGCGGVTTILNANTSDSLICTGETTTVNIDLADVVDLWGYQFEVSYDQAKASAVGAFVNSFFDTTGAYPAWDADCTTTPGTCKFAVTKQASVPPVPPVLPVNGSGPLAQITLTGLLPGTFNMVISNNVLSDIDGVVLYHNLGVPLPITVCGYATISGFITMQGRPGNNVNVGTVSMIEQGSPTNFTPVAPVNFSASNGAYSIAVPYMPGGSSYKIVAEHGLYLDNDDTITVSANLANKNTRLWGGDADNGGKVGITDLSCIGGAFGQSPVTSDCGGAGSPDINADTRVNIQDLSLAGGNYDKCGPQPWNWSVDPPDYTCP